MLKIKPMFCIVCLSLILFCSSGKDNEKPDQPVVSCLVQLGNPEKEKSPSLIRLHITALEFSPDGKMLASGRRNGSIAVWNMESNTLMYEIKGIDDFMKRVFYGFDEFIRFRPEGTSFLSFTENDKIHEWDAHTGKPMENPFIPLEKPQHAKSSNFHFALSPGAYLIAYYQISQGILVADAKTGKTIKKLNAFFPISWFSFSPDRKCLLTVGSHNWNDAGMYNIENGEGIWSKKSPTSGTDTPFFSGCAFSPDGKFFALATDAYWGGATIQLWQYPSQKESTIFKLKQGHIKFAFSPDGNYIAASGLHPHVEIFEVKTGNKIVEFKAHNERVYAIAFSPDGKKLATGSEDTTIKIWDMTGIRVNERITP